MVSSRESKKLVFVLVCLGLSTPKHQDGRPGAWVRLVVSSLAVICYSEKFQVRYTMLVNSNAHD